MRSWGSRELYIDGTCSVDVRLAVCEDQKIYKLHSRNRVSESIIGNIYIARLDKISPSLQASFITYSNEKQGFLPISEISEIYKNSNPRYNTIKLNNLQSTLYSIDVDNDELSDDPTNRMKNCTIGDQFSLQRGKKMLVQVKKDSKDLKNPSFTTFISLKGKYMIFFPNKSGESGVSSNIVGSHKRKRVKKLIDLILQKSQMTCQASIIARSGAADVSSEEIINDYLNLCDRWNNIIEKIGKSSLGSIELINDFLEKSLIESLDSRISKIFVEGVEIYNKVLKFIRCRYKEYINKLYLYQDNIPLFSKMKLETKILNLHLPKVVMKSGAYIVINPTEALTAVDVNSGSMLSRENYSKTAFKINIEAAIEIANQVRLRGISGLVVVDFIDMNSEESKLEVARVIKKELALDSARTKVGKINEFGTLTFSRQRSDVSFHEAHNIICSDCMGKGVIYHKSVLGSLILRLAREEVNVNRNNDHRKVTLEVHPTVATYMLQTMKRDIHEMENRTGLKFYFINSKSENVEYFSINIK